MPRQKKDGIPVTYLLRRDIKERLDTYCEEKGQTATLAVERILDKALKEYEEGKDKHPNEE